MDSGGGANPPDFFLVAEGDMQEDARRHREAVRSGWAAQADRRRSPRALLSILQDGDGRLAWGGRIGVVALEWPCVVDALQRYR
eukprot:gene13837-biopygen11688